MQNHVRYVGDGRNSAWFLPFPVSEPRDISVTRSINGEERRLAAGTDYQLDPPYLRAFLPDGAILAAWLNEAPETVDKKARDALAAAPAHGSALRITADTGQAPAREEDPHALTAARLEANLARSDALLRDTEAQCRIILADAREKAREIIAAASSESLAAIRQEALKLQRDAENMRAAEALIPGYLDRAEASADQAARAASTLAGAASAQADHCQECADQAALAAKSADMAWDYARAAVHAACATSTHHFRPGISAVHSLAEISCCAHGLFIVNPHITHAPTPFMGIWPVADLAEAAWDGIFFVGEKYPCPCAEPPKCSCPPKPVLPDPPDNPGDSDDWQPCGHRHQDNKCLCRG